MSEIPNVGNQVHPTQYPLSSTVDTMQVKGKIETEEQLENEKLKQLFEDFTNFMETQPPKTRSAVNKLIEILLSLVQTQQDIAIAQADTQSILTQLNNAFVQLQQNVPILTAEMGLDSLEKASDRDRLNTQLSLFMETIKANRGAVAEDPAKQQQTRLNATKDALTSFTDYLTKFVNDQESIINTMFK